MVVDKVEKGWRQILAGIALANWSLLASPRTRQLMQAQAAFYLAVKDSEGVFGPAFPENVDKLCFQVASVIRDPVVPRGLFDLFAEVLNVLCHMGSAYEDDPDLAL